MQTFDEVVNLTTTHTVDADVVALDDATEALLAEALNEWAIITIGSARYTDRRAQAAYLSRCLNSGSVEYPFEVTR